MGRDHPPPQRHRSPKRRVPITPFAVAIGVIFVSAVVSSTGGSRGDTIAAPPTVAPSVGAPIWVPTLRRIDRTEQEQQRVRIPSIATDSDAGLISGRAGLPDGDGGFVVAGSRARLDGLIFPDRSRVCVGATGVRWACGLRAHALFGSLINGREIACRPKNPAATAEPIRAMADCRSRGRSLAERLVGEGWVDVEAEHVDPALVTLHARAVAEKRGLWADVPPP